MENVFLKVVWDTCRSFDYDLNTFTVTAYHPFNFSVPVLNV